MTERLLQYSCFVHQEQHLNPALWAVADLDEETLTKERTLLEDTPTFQLEELLVQLFDQAQQVLLCRLSNIGFRAVEHCTSIVKHCVKARSVACLQDKAHRKRPLQELNPQGTDSHSSMKIF